MPQAQEGADPQFIEEAHMKRSDRRTGESMSLDSEVALFFKGSMSIQDHRDPRPLGRGVPTRLASK